MSDSAVPNGSDDGAPRNGTRHSWLSLQFQATLFCAALVVTIDMAAYLTAAPQLRLFESIICLDYYAKNDPGVVDGNGDIPEKYCKVDAVQEELAMLNGFQTLFSNIPGRCEIY